MDFSFLYTTQPKVVKLINNSFKKNRLSQVLLFDGIKGTPKVQAAMYLTNILMCNEHNICGKCLECRRIDEDVHPRLFRVSPENGGMGTIKKEQIDELKKEFEYSSIEEGPRVFIINDIDKATLSAANSLLKFLEELKENCYGILITENMNAVLKTIISRCQVITFDKISDDVLEDIYESKGLDKEMAKVLCSLTNNSNEGLELAKDEMLINIISLIKKITKGFLTDVNPIYIMNEEGKFLLSCSDKKYHQLFLDLLITITNDRLFYVLGEIDEIVFNQTLQDMEDFGIDVHKISYKDTFKQVEIMLDFKKKLNYNINLELMYMDLFIKCEVKK